MNDQDPNAMPLLDHDTLEELRDIMEDDFADLVDTFLHDLPGQLSAIDQAANGGDTDALYRSAHKLKSGSGSIGALRLAEMAKRLEQMGRNACLEPVPAALEQLHTVAAATEPALRGLLAHDSQ